MDCVWLLHLTLLGWFTVKKPQTVVFSVFLYLSFMPLCLLIRNCRISSILRMRSFTSFQYSKEYPHPCSANLSFCLYFSTQRSFQFAISSYLILFLCQVYPRMILSGENVFSQPRKDNRWLQMHRWVCMQTDVSHHLSYSEVSEKFLDFPQKTPKTKTRIRAPIFAVKPQTPLYYQFCRLYWLY